MVIGIGLDREVEHPYKWMRTEQANIWLGVTPAQVQNYFTQARLVG